MPVLLAWLGELVVSSVGAWALSALVGLGVGFVASTVASGLIDSSQIMTALRSSSVMWGWVGYLKIDTDITIILSAWAGRAVTNSVQAHLTKLPKKA
jgi:hypothetical protein